MPEDRRLNRKTDRLPACRGRPRRRQLRRPTRPTAGMRESTSRRPAADAGRGRGGGEGASGTRPRRGPGACSTSTARAARPTSTSTSTTTSRSNEDKGRCELDTAYTVADGAHVTAGEQIALNGDTGTRRQPAPPLRGPPERRRRRQPAPYLKKGVRLLFPGRLGTRFALGLRGVPASAGRLSFACRRCAGGPTAAGPSSTPACDAQASRSARRSRARTGHDRVPHVHAVRRSAGGDVTVFTTAGQGDGRDAPRRRRQLAGGAVARGRRHRAASRAATGRRSWRIAGARRAATAPLLSEDCATTQRAPRRGTRRSRRSPPPGRTPRSLPAAAALRRRRPGPCRRRRPPRRRRRSLAQQVDDSRHEGHVRPRQDRDADRVGVLLDRGLDDLLRGLVQARVDHLHAGIAERTSDDLAPRS